jgi:hypothetical protein
VGSLYRVVPGQRSARRDERTAAAIGAWTNGTVDYAGEGGASDACTVALWRTCVPFGRRVGAGRPLLYRCRSTRPTPVPGQAALEWNPMPTNIVQQVQILFMPYGMKPTGMDSADTHRQKTPGRALDNRQHGGRGAVPAISRGRTWSARWRLSRPIKRMRSGREQGTPSPDTRLPSSCTRVACAPMPAPRYYHTTSLPHVRVRLYYSREY